HEGEQRGDDDGGPGRWTALHPGAEERGGDEVHGRLAPAGALDHEGTAAVDDERLDRAPLVRPEPGVGPSYERLERCLRPGLGRHCVHVASRSLRSHVAPTPAATASSGGRRAWASRNNSALGARAGGAAWRVCSGNNSALGARGWGTTRAAPGTTQRSARGGGALVTRG